MKSLHKVYQKIRIFSRDKSNFVYLVYEEIFYYTANACFDTVSVIPVFIDMLTGNLKLVGLSATLRNIFFILPQIFMGFYTYRLKSIPRFMAATSFAARSSIFVFLLVFALRIPTPYTVVFFMLMCAMIGFGDGIINVPWLDLIGGTIHENKRGKLFAYMLALGGIGSFLAGILIKNTLSSPLSFTVRFMIIFGTGGTFFMLSSLCFARMVDYKRNMYCVSSSFKNFIAGIPGYLFKNKDYFHVMLTLVLNYFSNLTLPLYIVFARRSNTLDDSATGILVFAQLIGIIAGGGLWGFLSHTAGNKKSIQAVVLTNLILPVMAIASTYIYNTNISFAVLTAVSLGAGAATVGWPGFVNYIISISPEKDRAAYIALTNGITLPLSFLSLLGGFLSEYLGFLPVFTAVIVLCSFSILTSLKLKS